MMVAPSSGPFMFLQEDKAKGKVSFIPHPFGLMFLHPHLWGPVDGIVFTVSDTHTGFRLVCQVWGPLTTLPCLPSPSLWVVLTIELRSPRVLGRRSNTQYHRPPALRSLSGASYGVHLGMVPFHRILRLNTVKVYSSLYVLETMRADCVFILWCWHA